MMITLSQIHAKMSECGYVPMRDAALMVELAKPESHQRESVRVALDLIQQDTRSFDDFAAVMNAA